MNQLISMEIWHFISVVWRSFAAIYWSLLVSNKGETKYRKTSKNGKNRTGIEKYRIKSESMYKRPTNDCFTVYYTEMSMNGWMSNISHTFRFLIFLFFDIFQFFAFILYIPFVLVFSEPTVYTDNQHQTSHHSNERSFLMNTVKYYDIFYSNVCSAYNLALSGRNLYCLLNVLFHIIHWFSLFQY